MTRPADPVEVLITVSPTGRVMVSSEITYFAQTERLLSGEPWRDLLIKEDEIRRMTGIPSIFADS